MTPLHLPAPQACSWKVKLLVHARACTLKCPQRPDRRNYQIWGGMAGGNSWGYFWRMSPFRPRNEVHVWGRVCLQSSQGWTLWYPLKMRSPRRWPWKDSATGKTPNGNTQARYVTCQSPLQRLCQFRFDMQRNLDSPTHPNQSHGARCWWFKSCGRVETGINLVKNLLTTSKIRYPAL